jgi:hypothetical protein
MADKRSKLDKATDLVAQIIQEQINTLPPAVAAAKRKELRDLAASFSPSSDSR